MMKKEKILIYNFFVFKKKLKNILSFKTIKIWRKIKLKRIEIILEITKIRILRNCFAIA